MSVLIKGMEMPDRCYGCFVRNWGYSGDGMKCHITGSVTSWHDGCLKRMDNCPLIPIPDHGRLIDADALCAKDNDDFETALSMALSVSTKSAIMRIHEQMQAVVSKAPTIIPADKEGEG